MSGKELWGRLYDPVMVVVPDIMMLMCWEMILTFFISLHIPFIGLTQTYVCNVFFGYHLFYYCDIQYLTYICPCLFTVVLMLDVIFDFDSLHTSQLIYNPSFKLVHADDQFPIRKISIHTVAWLILNQPVFSVHTVWNHEASFGNMLSSCSDEKNVM